jgi:hypothetical protein
MNKSEIEDEIQLIENIIKDYKENNTPVNLYIPNLYIPILFRLSQLKNDNPQPLPLINLIYHDIIIDLNFKNEKTINENHDDKLINENN